jgi:RNA polymerase sigma factor (sigma-70 family)
MKRVRQVANLTPRPAAAGQVADRAGAVGVGLVDGPPGAGDEVVVGVEGGPPGAGDAAESWNDDFLVQFVRARLPRSLRPIHSAADIIQSVRLLICQKQHQWRGESEAQFRNWVLKIARHRIIDGLRQSKRARLHQAAYGNHGPRGLAQGRKQIAPDPLSAVIWREQIATVVAALEALPPDLRHIVWLRFIQERTYPQIAAELHLPITTCRRRCQHGCYLLGRQLGQFQPLPRGL